MQLFFSFIGNLSFSIKEKRVMEIAAKQRDIIAKRWFCDFNVRGESEHMRLDKYLKVSRLIKRRPVANEACDAGRIQVNGKVAKASLNVKVGDIIEITFGDKVVKVEVLSIEETYKKDEARELYKVL